MYAYNIQNVIWIFIEFRHMYLLHTNAYNNIILNIKKKLEFKIKISKHHLIVFIKIHIKKLSIIIFYLVCFSL